jgi:RNA polymerase sigma factor (sigma-70 family)
MKEDRDLYPAQVVPTADTVPGVAAARSGTVVQDSALGAVYDKYLPLLRKIAMRKFGVPRADVDSLIHDVFTTYLVQQDRVRELHPYLVGAICNASREYWRKANRDRDFFTDAAVGAVAVDDHILESVAQNLLVRSALSRLGASCRETLHRFYVDGESSAAIAESRQTTQNSILRLLHYCRERARAAYRALTEAGQ